jgi:hypothetical protein
MHCGCVQAKSVCKWRVQQPPLQHSNSTAAAAAAAARHVPGVSSEDTWQVLKLQRSSNSSEGSSWSSPTLNAVWAQQIRESMLKELSQNFS